MDLLFVLWWSGFVLMWVMTAYWTSCIVAKGKQSPLLFGAMVILGFLHYVRMMPENAMIDSTFAAVLGCCCLAQGIGLAAVAKRNEKLESELQIKTRVS